MDQASRSHTLGCHRCDHSWSDHQQRCTVAQDTPDACTCPGFRWVDPAPGEDVLGYHRPTR